MLARLPRLELVYQDGSGSTGSITVNLKSGVTVATAEAGASALASAVSLLTGAVLVRQRIMYRFVNETAPTAAIGSYIKRVGVFVYECEVPEQLAIVEVPGISEAVILSDGPSAGVEIDASNPDVIAFNDVIIDGNVCNPFLSAITEFLIAYRQSRV